MTKEVLKDVDFTCSLPRCSHVDGIYRMRMVCHNCGHRFIGMFSRGHETGSLQRECPRCGCRKASANGWAS